MSFIAQRICLKIGAYTLLDDVDLHLTPGELLVVLGPNGAGKSSLLKVLTGEHAQFQGDLSVDGHNLQHLPAATRAQHMAILPQQSSLAFSFTVAEVVLLGRSPHNTGRDRDMEIVQEVLDQVDMLSFIDTPYPLLSGGEQQRVQLARVLAQIWEPIAGPFNRYLMLDEPTSAMDIAHQHLTLKIARTCCQQGIGVLAILHDLNLAAEYADRIMMLEKGRVAHEGRVASVLNAEAIKQLYGIEVAVVSHPVSNKPLVISA